MNKNIRLVFDDKKSGSVFLISEKHKEEIAKFSCCDSFSLSAEVKTKRDLIRVTSEDIDFSFFMRDVNDKFPIIIKEYKCAVLQENDKRSYKDILSDTLAKGGKTKIEEYEAGEEESFEKAAKNTRNMKASAWLGVGRDIRLFEVGFHGEDMSSYFSASQQVQTPWDYIVPRYHKDAVKLSVLNDEECHYRYMIGKGIGCTQDISRWLEKDCLPILHADINDEDIVYHATYFTSLLEKKLVMENIEGTHYLVADSHSYAYTQTEEQQKITDSIYESEIFKKEKTVMFMEVVAENITSSPKYAFMRLPVPNLGLMPDMLKHHVGYDGEKGFGTLSDGSIYMTATLNGEPCEDVENSILLLPGEKARFIVSIPHSPISNENAKMLIGKDYDKTLSECIDYWENELDTPAQISLPEKRIENMLKAGLLHIKIMLYGNEPSGTLAPSVGMYCSIGSESSQIIDYLDSVGEHEIAERAIMFFFEKQHDNGFMQNFVGYMLETGAVLFLLSKHIKATGNYELVKKLLPKIKKACNYLINWRNENKKEELIKNGYGMISGKVADPEDNFHSYMLNAYAVAGLKHGANLILVCGDEYGEEVLREAEDMTLDIRESLIENLAASPLVPYGDGFWRPSVSPWTEYKGPLCLYAEGGNCITHGAVVSRDSLLGALWLIPLGVVDANEKIGEFILNLATEHFHMRNSAYSQPYYSAHPFAHIKRGEVNSYLMEFYNSMAGLADRETYTFWEHYFHDSAHKLAEEAMFMQRVRHLLWTEDGKTLSIFSMAPRAWFEAGKKIKVTNVKSLLGNLSFEVSVNEDKTYMSVKLEVKKVVDTPEKIKIRLPHPDKKSILNVSDSGVIIEGETLVLDGFVGKCEFTVSFS